MKHLTSLLLVLVTILTAQAQTINIETSTTQIILKVKDNGRLYQTWLGTPLHSAATVSETDMPRSSTTNMLSKGCEAYPVMGTEDYFEPAFEIRHADGNPTSVFKYVGHEQTNNETTIHLKDELYPVFLTLHYTAYPEEGVIRQWTEIHHEEKGRVELGRYASAMLYFEEQDYWLTQFTSDWAKEMQMQTLQLTTGRKVLDSRLGTRSTMFTPPFFMVGLDTPATEEQGTVFMGTLAWTGNVRFTFEVDHNRQLRIISGINPDASHYTLKRGEAFRTPDFIYTLSQQGTGDGSRRLQQWMMENQLYKGKDDRLTLLNNWENTYFRFDEEKLNALYGEAKDLGTDLFLLDDGWFGNKYPRNNDRQGLGDWQVMEKKLPHGLPFTIKQCEEKGLGFGIWIEPEMVNPKSELAEKHPD